MQDAAILFVPRRHGKLCRFFSISCFLIVYEPIYAHIKKKKRKSVAINTM